MQVQDATSPSMKRKLSLSSDNLSDRASIISTFRQVDSASKRDQIKEPGMSPKLSFMHIFVNEFFQCLEIDCIYSKVVFPSSSLSSIFNAHRLSTQILLELLVSSPLSFPQACCQFPRL